jgi:hypothetical protein
MPLDRAKPTELQGRRHLRTLNGIMENRRVSVNDEAVMLQVNYGSAHYIIHYVFQFHKVCARWVPTQVASELKKRRVNACQELLRQYDTEGYGFADAATNYFFAFVLFI